MPFIPRKSISWPVINRFCLDIKTKVQIFIFPFFIIFNQEKTFRFKINCILDRKEKVGLDTYCQFQSVIILLSGLRDGPIWAQSVFFDVLAYASYQ